jgi:hypothetical protein
MEDIVAGKVIALSMLTSILQAVWKTGNGRQQIL